MTIPYNRFFSFRHISTRQHQEWLDQSVSNETSRLMIGVSGYEARSSDWIKKTLSKLPPSETNAYLILGFDEYQQDLSRPDNDKFYQEKGLRIVIPKNEGKMPLDIVKEITSNHVSKNGKLPIEVHVDYSSMPRSWYCNLPFVLADIIRPIDRLFFWYTPGEYPETEYPTAGVDDFRVFSGRPSLNPKRRTHFLGLGFDRIRAHAIWSVLDPTNIVCFYVSPGSRPGYVERVERDNKDIISAADHVFTVDMRDFAYTYSRIAGAIREFHQLGDVIIVPDGPKPLILASSLIPGMSENAGIVCFHVSRRRNQQSKPINVDPIGSAFAFSFSISEKG